MTLAWPTALWALGAVPLLVIALALDGQRRRRILERIGHLPQIRRLTASLSLVRRRVKAALVVAALAALVVALARPQLPGQAHMLPRRGLDLVVALDFSRSMLAADIYPTRLDRAKAELDKLIDGLKGDRVGLVAFAGVTLSYPLTTDYGAAKLFWRDLQPGDIPVGGTNLGEAIRGALELLAHAHDHEKDKRKPSQIIVLLTDGADTEGAAAQAVKKAAEAGVKIFPVGIGSREGEVVVLQRKDDGSAEYVTDDQGKPMRMELDEPALKQMAQATAGEYFAFDAERFGVERVQKAVAGLERVEEEGRVVREPDEAYGWFAGGALALLVLELLLGDRRRRRPGSDETEGRMGTRMQTGDPAPPRARRLGGRRRIGGAAATTAGPDARRALALVILLPWLGGWSWFERPSPDVAEGNRKLAAGKAEEALAAYERALGARPDDLAIHYDRGAALYALGRMPEALREFERAAEATDPQLRADAFYNAGNAHLKQQKLAEAITAYKHALRLRPEDRRAKWNLELALRRQQEEEQKKQQQAKQDNKDDKDNKDDRDQQQQQNPDGKDDKKDEQQAKQDARPQDSKDQKDQQAKKEQKDQKDQQAKKDEQKSAEQKQAEQQKQAQAEKDKQDQQADKPQPQPGDKQDDKKGDQQGQQAQAGHESKDKPGDKKPGQAQAVAGQPMRDIDKQDAEAVLDAFERVEPTVQKDLAKRRAGNRRPRKDW